VLCSIRYAEGTLLLCHFGTLHPSALRLAFVLSHAKSNYSRTSTPFGRKSNHSRTYAKTGGRGHLLQNTFSHKPFTFFCQVIYMVNYMNYYIVGAPTISLLRGPRSRLQSPGARSVVHPRGQQIHCVARRRGVPCAGT